MNWVILYWKYIGFNRGKGCGKGGLGLTEGLIEGREGVVFMCQAVCRWCYSSFKTHVFDASTTSILLLWGNRYDLWAILRVRLIASDSHPAILPHIGPKTINSKRFPLCFGVWIGWFAFSGCFLLGSFDDIDIIGSPRSGGNPLENLFDIVESRESRDYSLLFPFDASCTIRLTSFRGK